MPGPWEGKKPTEEELQGILRAHREWLETYKDKIKAGQRPINPPNNLKRIDLSGLDLRNVNLNWVKIEIGDLEGSDFSGANLSHAEFADCRMIKTILRGATINSAVFKGSDLTEADLRKADLTASRFIGGTLLDANLHDANLRGTSLSQAPVLTYDQLGRSFLKHASLPENVSWEDYIPSVRLAASQARKLFTPMVALCFYALFSVFGAGPNGDPVYAAFKGKIDIMYFIAIKSIALAAISFYLFYYLNQLWRMISKLPAVFPNGSPISEHPDPWFIINYSRIHLFWLKKDSSGIALFWAWLSAVVVYLLPVTTLLFLWGKTLEYTDSGLPFVVFICFLSTLAWSCWGVDSSVRILQKV